MRLTSVESLDKTRRRAFGRRLGLGAAALLWLCSALPGSARAADCLDLLAVSPSWSCSAELSSGESVDYCLNLTDSLLKYYAESRLQPRAVYDNGRQLFVVLHVKY